MTKHMAPISAPDVSDHRIETPDGALFARLWRPARDSGKTAILLLHDSLGSVELWRDFPEKLCAATGRRVTAYDRLGFGRSDANRLAAPLPRDFVQEETRHALSVADALGLTLLAPFGHSVGGGMAIQIAAAHPARCTALITEAAQSIIEERTLAGIRAARASFAEPGQIERLQRYHGAKARWVLDAWTETWLAPGFAGWRLDDELSQVRCPVLAIHGERDEFGAVTHAERIANLGSGPGKALILADCGHVPHRERQDDVLAATAAFLATIP